MCVSILYWSLSFWLTSLYIMGSSFIHLIRTDSNVYYQGWNRSPAQVGRMRQVLRAGALGRPRGMGWRGRWEWGLGWGIHVNPWLIHVNVWQKPLKYCKAISLQLIKINGKKKKKVCSFTLGFTLSVIHSVDLHMNNDMYPLLE